MAGWHRWLDRHEFEQALEVGYGLGSLGCCSPWGRKESDMTEQLNWTKLRHLEITLNGNGVEGGREVQEGGDMCIPMSDHFVKWQKPTQYFTAIILQLKINKFIEKKKKLWVKVEILPESGKAETTSCMMKWFLFFRCLVL